MAVQDGQPVNAAVTNAALMSRTQNTDTIGKVDVLNTTQSTLPNNGSLHTKGGLGVEKNANVGENLSVAGTANVTGDITSSANVNAVDANLSGTTTTNILDVTTNANVSGTLDVAGNTSLTTVSASGLADLNSLQVTNNANIDGTLDVTGVATFDNNVIVQGDLTVNGTTTTLNTSTVDSEDPNVTLNKNGNDLSSEGSGLTIDRTGTKGSFVYENALTSKFKLGDLGSEAQVVTVSHTQTLTNKTLTSPTINTPIVDIATFIEQGSTPSTPASGNRKLYPKADGFYELDSTGLEKKIGTGSGGSAGKNFIEDGDADNSASSIFVPYADTGSRPVNGVGGSPTVTTSITSTSPLDGTKSYLLTKTAVNLQGEGWSIDFEVGLAYRAKACKISFDYIVNSGTFAAGTPTTDSDVIIYIYDITNSTLIEPSNIKMLASSTTLSDKFEASFQTSSTGSQYRLIFHIATTSASAYELKVDNVAVSPQTYVYGSPIIDYKPFTPTGSWVSNITYSGFYKQLGDTAKIKYYLELSNTSEATSLTLNLPPGLVIDTSKLLATEAQAWTLQGSFTARESGSSQKHHGKAVYYTTTSVRILFPYITTHTGAVPLEGGPNVTDTYPFTWGAGDYLEGEIEVPILGWSSSVQMSDSADTRIVVAKINKSGSQSITSLTETKITGFSVEYDSHGSFDIANDRFIIRTPGYYNIKAYNQISGTSGDAVIGYSINGGARIYPGTPTGSNTFLRTAAEGQEKLNIGDTIEFYAFTNPGLTFVATGSYSIEKVNGPAAIAASEIIACSYENTIGTTINITPATISFPTKRFDTHGTYASGIFTAPTYGIYYVDVKMFTTTTINASTAWYVNIIKNGSTGMHTNAKAGTGAANTTNCVSVSGLVELNQGQTIEVSSNLDTASSINLTAVSGYNVVSIHKLK